jgi:hypothetical protein
MDYWRCQLKTFKINFQECVQKGKNCLDFPMYYCNYAFAFGMLYYGSVLQTWLSITWQHYP